MLAVSLWVLCHHWLSVVAVSSAQFTWTFYKSVAEPY